MKTLLNLASVMLLCMFSLFFIEPGFGFVLAFLCAVILCCTVSGAENNTAFSFLCLCFFAAAILAPPFFFFYPAAVCCLFSRRCYRTAAAGCALFLLGAAAGGFPKLLLCLDLLGFFTAFLLTRRTWEAEQLSARLKCTQDDSTERDLLLTQKNRSILEKQDYEIYTATLRERNRIAREIHDNVGHLLSRSILLTGAVRALNENGTLTPALDSLDCTLNSAMDSIRASVHDLKDESVNLDEAVRALIKDFTFCPVHYLYDAGQNVPRDIKYSFISIVKEALSNVMRHSNATQVSITLREHPAMYQLCVEDNGTTAGRAPGLEAGSFDPLNGFCAERGMGLANMKERTAKLGGFFHILRENGFKILITIPKETII